MLTVARGEGTGRAAWVDRPGCAACVAAVPRWPKVAAASWVGAPEPAVTAAPAARTTTAVPTRNGAARSRVAMLLRLPAWAPPCRAEDDVGLVSRRRSVAARVSARWFA